jgi:hypothetical protein
MTEQTPAPKNKKMLWIGLGALVGLVCICLAVMVLNNMDTDAISTPDPVGAVQYTAAPDSTNTIAPTEAAPQTSTSPALSERCVPASAMQIDNIRQGVKSVEESNDIKTAWAVKSNDFESVWMVAAMIYGTGMEDGVGPGVWAISGEPDAPRLTISVTGFAKEFSSWPDGSTLSTPVTGVEDGVEEAKECAVMADQP